MKHIHKTAHSYLPANITLTQSLTYFLTRPVPPSCLSSPLIQGGKLALLLNVFADASFARRNEYIFRNKEAVRLASAIEYFIEKAR